MQLGIKTMHGAKIQKPPFLRIYASQCVVLVCISTVLLFADRVIAYSSLLGGIISIGPNIYFARLAFRFTGASAANDVSALACTRPSMLHSLVMPARHPKRKLARPAGGDGGYRLREAQAMRAAMAVDVRAPRARL